MVNVVFAEERRDEKSVMEVVDKKTLVAGEVESTTGEESRTGRPKGRVVDKIRIDEARRPGAVWVVF